MDPKTEKPLFARFRLPLSLVAAHALLVALAAYFRFGRGWNDGTIFIGYTLRFLDYPIVRVLDSMERVFDVTGDAFGFVLCALAGSVYWFVLGCGLQWVIGRLKKRSR